MMRCACDLILARRVYSFMHSASVNLKYLILRVDLHIHVHDCRLHVYLLAAVELGPWTLIRDVG